ncbi:hypothetical protein [Sulfoacidibacillus ferrooxidans]|uniref:Uncharacterized protein n=1 Tax=Sulfoacidibacillus ferrooxidans TaxID=2005001 RepID=A0A9X2AFA2_9BACL|nr:hypothetical protein [Sulfoacidibacillus ferrooxidans]MCI0184212.1 hypothetical protein [Sulfoacidibacillus ferrooxidans]
MSTTFTKEEMIQANQFRTLSQKALQQELQSHEKIGVLFQNTGLDAVMMSYERYAAMVERLTELEEMVENIQLIQEFGRRFTAPKEQWIEHPEGMSTLEMYRQRRKEQTSK